MRQPDDALVVHARAELGVDPGKLASPLRAAVSSIVAFLLGALLPGDPVAVSAPGTRADRRSRCVIGVVAAAVVGALDRPPGRGRSSARSPAQVLIVARRVRA